MVTAAPHTTFRGVLTAALALPDGVRLGRGRRVASGFPRFAGDPGLAGIDGPWMGSLPVPSGAAPGSVRRASWFPLA